LAKPASSEVYPASILLLTDGSRTPEGVSVVQNTLPTNPTTTEVDWVAKGPFSVQGILTASPSYTGIPVILSGNVTGVVTEYPGASAGWGGWFSGTVNSISGLPAPEAKDILGMLGNLSQFQLYGWVMGNTGIPSVIGGGVDFYPDGSAVPEPGSLVVFALLAIGYGVFHAVRARRAS